MVTATSALSGGRTDTPLKLTAAAISVMTSQFMEDVAATEFQSMVLWGTNVVMANTVTEGSELTHQVGGVISNLLRDNSFVVRLPIRAAVLVRHRSSFWSALHLLQCRLAHGAERGQRVQAFNVLRRIEVFGGRVAASETGECDVEVVVVATGRVTLGAQVVERGGQVLETEQARGACGRRKLWRRGERRPAVAALRHPRACVAGVAANPDRRAGRWPRMRGHSPIRS